MSASLKTTNYELGIYAPNDVTSWLTDFNGNMNKIDAQMKVNANGVQGNAGDINALTGRMTTAENDIEQLENEYGSLLQKVAVSLINTLPSSNIESIGNSLISILDTVVGNITCGLGNKKGNELSTITLTGTNSKGVPLLTIADNPFNLETVTSPGIDNISEIGIGLRFHYITSETVIGFGNAYAYYNGTNTLVLVPAGDSELTEDATWYTVTLNIAYTNN